MNRLQNEDQSISQTTFFKRSLRVYLRHSPDAQNLFEVRGITPKHFLKFIPGNACVVVSSCLLPTWTYKIHNAREKRSIVKKATIQKFFYGALERASEGDAVFFCQQNGVVGFLLEVDAGGQRRSRRLDGAVRNLSFFMALIIFMAQFEGGSEDDDMKDSHNHPPPIYSAAFSSVTSAAAAGSSAAASAATVSSVAASAGGAGAAASSVLVSAAGVSSSAATGSFTSAASSTAAGSSAFSSDGSEAGASGSATASLVSTATSAAGVSAASSSAAGFSASGSATSGVVSSTGFSTAASGSGAGAGFTSTSGVTFSTIVAGDDSTCSLRKQQQSIKCQEASNH
nr:hypothetical protein Iba_chr14aCG1220 [Ipomoea batatas]